MQSMWNVNMTGAVAAFLVSVAVVATGQLPDPGMTIDPENTALVVTDPQIDFLSPKGVTWAMVGKNVTEVNTVENLETLFKSSKANGIQVFISPPTTTSRPIMVGSSRVRSKKSCTTWACSTGGVP